MMATVTIDSTAIATMRRTTDTILSVVSLYTAARYDVRKKQKIKRRQKKVMMNTLGDSYLLSIDLLSE